MCNYHTAPGWRTENMAFCAEPRRPQQMLSQCTRHRQRRVPRLAQGSQEESCCSSCLLAPARAEAQVVADAQPHVDARPVSGVQHAGRVKARRVTAAQRAACGGAAPRRSGKVAAGAPPAAQPPARRSTARPSTSGRRARGAPLRPCGAARAREAGPAHALPARAQAAVPHRLHPDATQARSVYVVHACTSALRTCRSRRYVASSTHRGLLSASLYLASRRSLSIEPWRRSGGREDDVLADVRGVSCSHSPVRTCSSSDLGASEQSACRFAALGRCYQGHVSRLAVAALTVRAQAHAPWATRAERCTCARGCAATAASSRCSPVP